MSFNKERKKNPNVHLRSGTIAFIIPLFYYMIGLSELLCFTNQTCSKQCR